MLYVTYNIDTRRVERIDDIQMVFDDDNLITMEKDITFDDDIVLNLSVYKVDDEGNFYIEQELVEERQFDILRGKRAPLLEAFDIYKSNLIVGAITPTEEEKQEVLDWYQLILDLDEEAINNPPELIVRYIQ